MAKQTKTNKEVLNDRKRNKGVHSKIKIHGILTVKTIRKHIEVKADEV